jgi:hypothetical protein
LFFIAGIRRKVGFVRSNWKSFAVIRAIRG